MGSGKISEIRELISDQNIDTVICDDELEPSQQLSMESALGSVKVIDRTALILDIFASKVGWAMDALGEIRRWNRNERPRRVSNRN